ncbi:MAG: hypothetical protein J6Q38_03475 [Clostridia bacterium]|nr:hypothetical protein [Clostridia bacterium]
MSAYDIYVFLLCLIVFALLAGLSTILLITIIKLTVKLIRHGVEDEQLKTEYLEERKNKKCAIIRRIDLVLSSVLCVLLCAVFAFSLYINVTGKNYSYDLPTLKTVNSASMSKKHEKNTWLFENNLNDQIQTFDLILTYKAPDEFDLKLYDIVVYEVDGTYVVHRIIRIEEPNDAHPNERWFLCQGDNVESPDRFPVHYDQIKGIYRGERIPFIGSFVTFMQSPAGWLCIIYVLVAVILTPIVEKRIKNEKTARLTKIGFIDSLNEDVVKENK